MKYILSLVTVLFSLSAHAGPICSLCPNDQPGGFPAACGACPKKVPFADEELFYSFPRGTAVTYLNGSVETISEDFKKVFVKDISSISIIGVDGVEVYNQRQIFSRCK